MFRMPLVSGLLALILMVLPGQVSAHPMPSTTLQLEIQSTGVTAKLALPLDELRLATRWSVPSQAGALQQDSPRLKRYLRQHLAVTTASGQPWTVTLGTPRLTQTEQTATGPYQEVVVPVQLTPPAGVSTRNFTLRYDAIVHQVATHVILVSVRQDWERGLLGERPVQLGVIRTDTRLGTVPPLRVDQAHGSAWQGFLGMIQLGMRHIAEGTDHLLFLLTLLLPAPLLAVMNRRPHWGSFGGTRRSLLNIVRIVSAFTIGHSLTLLLGTLRLITLPDQLTEALIAVSILVSALHALRPIFPEREMLVAAGFGLIHGLAFSSTLAELNLSPWQTALSLLGFNLGIEAVQLVVVTVTVPWLMLLARTPLSVPVRALTASFAGLAALGWLGQRLGLANPLGGLADRLSSFGPWLVTGLAVLAVLGSMLNLRRSQTDPDPV